jgi:hypothetical protein
MTDGYLSKTPHHEAGSQVQNFTYDTLDRLLSANAVGGSGGLYSESYAQRTGARTYDPNTGNLSSKAGVNYTYSPTKVHAVTSLSNGNSYGYDATPQGGAGAMATRPAVR